MLLRHYSRFTSPHTETLWQTLTLVAAPRPHARLKICGVRAGNAQVQLSLQHPLPHSLALFTGGRAAGRPRRPVGVDTGLRRVICRVMKQVEIMWQPTNVPYVLNLVPKKKRGGKSGEVLADLPPSPPGQCLLRCRPRCPAQCCTVLPVDTLTSVHFTHFLFFCAA